MEEPKQKVIKLIVEGMCPHCSQKIMIAHHIFAPMIEWVLKPKDLDDAKENLKKKVQNSPSINDEEKKNVLTWLEDKNTLLGPAEVDNILMDLVKPEATPPTEEKK